jgi:flagellar hook assembly protein FlgD
VLALSRPSPNPSNASVLMRYSLPAGGSARLEVVDVNGRRVWVEEAAGLSAGDHAAVWNGRTVNGQPASAGLYFVRLLTEAGTRTERLVRMR